MSWHVLLTEPNREKTAERQLRRLKLSPYLPTFTRSACYRRPKGRRWRITERALFPGYMFIPALDFPRFEVVREIAIGIWPFSCPFLRHDGRPADIDEGKITEIRRLEKHLRETSLRGMNFRRGDRVRVVDGPLMGMWATVQMLTDQERIALLVDFLGRSSRVEIASDQVAAA